MKQIKVETLYTLQPDGTILSETQILHEGRVAAPPSTVITKATLRSIIRPQILAAIVSERAIRDDARARGQTAVEAEKERSLAEVIGFRDAVDAL